MRKPGPYWLAAAVLLLCGAARATIFGGIRGIVHDPQHRPINGAVVKLQSKTSDWSQSTETDADGEFTFTAVPLGDYSITISAAGFETAEQSLTVVAGSSPVLHLPLKLASIHQTATVSAQADAANVDSVTPTTLVQPQRHSADARRRSHQQPSDHHRLRSRLVRHARPASRSRGTSSELADRRGAHSEHQHRQ